MDSQPAIQRRYGDLSMMIRPEMRHFSIYDILLEFKYVPLNKLIVGNHQLTGQEIQQKSRQELLAMDAIKTERTNARSQLRDYQQKLKTK